MQEKVCENLFWVVFFKGNLTVWDIMGNKGGGYICSLCQMFVKLNLLNLPTQMLCNGLL
jgi:hypothetical protein